jgi:hypothetical protein
VQNPDSALARERGCHAGFGDLIHCGGNKWDGESDISGESGGRINIGRQDVTPSWHQNNIVKGQTLVFTEQFTGFHLLPPSCKVE